MSIVQVRGQAQNHAPMLLTAMLASGNLVSVRRPGYEFPDPYLAGSWGDKARRGSLSSKAECAQSFVLNGHIHPFWTRRIGYCAIGAQRPVSRNDKECGSSSYCLLSEGAYKSKESIPIVVEVCIRLKPEFMHKLLHEQMSAS